MAESLSIIKSPVKREQEKDHSTLIDNRVGFIPVETQISVFPSH